MKNKMIIDFARLLVGVALVFALSACQASHSTRPSEQPATVSAADEPVEPWDGDGMDIPLDGSSLEAFNMSLARIKAHSSAANYTTLVNAVDYLLLYDLSAKRDRTRLAANLDGLTGRQVIDKVKWQK